MSDDGNNEEEISYDAGSRASVADSASIAETQENQGGGTNLKKKKTRTTGNGATKTTKAAAGSKNKPGSEEAENTVLEYLTAQCRPYNSTKVYENLLKTISHTIVKNVLVALVSRGMLQEKVEGRASLYWVTQTDGSDTVEDRDALCKNLQQEIDLVNTVLQDTRADFAIEQQSIAALQQEPADHDIDNEITLLNKSVSEMSRDIQKIRKSAIEIPSNDVTDDRSLEDLRCERKFYEVSARCSKRIFQLTNACFGFHLSIYSTIEMGTRPSP